MLELKGKYNIAKVFTDNIDNETISQLILLLNQPYIADSQIRIMPDTHAGAGCVIGTTMTLTDKVCPNLVGVDIGCSVSAFQLKETYARTCSYQSSNHCQHHYIQNELAYYRRNSYHAQLHRYRK